MTLGAFAEVLPSVRRFRLDLGIALVAATVAQALGIPLALLTRWTINRAAANLEAGASHASLQGLLLTFGAVFAALTLLRGAMRWVQTLRGERAAQGVLADVRGRMYQHLQRLSQGYFDRRPTGKILIRFIGDANSLRTWVARTLITVPAECAAS